MNQDTIYFLIQLGIVVGAPIFLAIIIAFPFIVIGRLGRIIKLLDQIAKK